LKLLAVSIMCAMRRGGSLATNDNWKDTQQAEIQASGKAPPTTMSRLLSLCALPPTPLRSWVARTTPPVSLWSKPIFCRRKQRRRVQKAAVLRAEI